MKNYRYLVSLCGGWCDRFIEVKENDKEKAYDKAMDLVVDKLVLAFPTLGIDYNVELYDEQELPDDAVVKCKDCGKEMLEEDAEYCDFNDGSDYICSDCLDNYGYCEACGKYYNEEKDNVEIYGLRGGCVCSECYDAHGWKYE